MIAGAVEAHHLVQKAAVLGAGHQLVGHPAVAQRQADFGLFDDLRELAGAQHRHGVDHHRARLGRRQPRGDHRRVVAGADQHTVAGAYAVVLDQRMGEAIGPIGQLLVRAPAPVPDQGDPVAMTGFDLALRQLDGDVQVVGVLILRLLQQQIGPLLRRRQMVAGESVFMCAGSEHIACLLSALTRRGAPQCASASRAIITFCTSDAPS